MWSRYFIIKVDKLHNRHFTYSEIIRTVGFSSSKLKPSNTAELKECDSISLLGKNYARDEYTNVSPHVLSYLSKNLHNQKNHPLNILKLRVIRYIYGNYINRRGNPLFSVYDKLSPVVTTYQNFDSLLVPSNHVCRSKSDSYYLNSNYLLRPHTSAHQNELIKSGLDHFLVIGDVYRRDEIDSKHYPVFHQCEAVRLLSTHELFKDIPNGEHLQIFEKDTRRPEKQECHTLEATKLMEKDLKSCLTGLVKCLFGPSIEYKWSESYFPFTHPSWELEVHHEGEWLEVLGCGIMEQEILNRAGASKKIGWAFGIGLERIAMKLYSIPDIRLFWSTDSGFLSQFDVKDIETPVKFKAVSKYPQCINDISFWIPEDFHANDFYDLVRSIGGEIIEQVHKVDEFYHPKHKKLSYCFRIIYRHMERTLCQKEVNEIHKDIENAAVRNLNVKIR